MKKLSLNFHIIFLYFCISAISLVLQNTPSEIISIDDKNNSKKTETTFNQIQTEIKRTANPIPPRKLSLSLQNKKDNNLRKQLTNEKIGLIMKKLKTKDRPFYRALLKLNNDQKREYLVLNRERLLLGLETMLGGLAGVGIAAAALLLKTAADAAKLKALNQKFTTTKQGLYQSNMQRRKEVEELQEQLYQVDNALSGLRDVLADKSTDLHNSIGNKLGF